MSGQARRQALEYTGVTPSRTGELARFFAALVDNGDEVFFHPHPLTHEQAVQQGQYQGHDLYCLQLFRDRISGYGMLRGWDEGFAVPSLGLAIHPRQRGRGLGRDLLLFLLAAARRRGAETVRLTVHRENHGAVRLYRSMGFLLQEKTPGVLEGFLVLQDGPGMPYRKNGARV